jgi:metal-responsive CopG/Arc/MetJ family transcriptional regulator
MDTLRITLFAESFEKLHNISILTKKKKSEVVSDLIDAYYQSNKQVLDEIQKTKEEYKPIITINQIDILSGDWEKIIEIFLEQKTETTIREIAKECFEIESKDLNKAIQMRIGKYLNSWGWYRQTGYRGDRVIKFWERKIPCPIWS